MRDGAKIINSSSCAVWIDRGNFRMYGGNITENGGAAVTAGAGGVHMNNNSIFTMRGGTISNNTGRYSGGVYIASSNAVNNLGIFIKEGGIIYGNISAAGIGHSVRVRQGGSTLPERFLNNTVPANQRIDTTIAGPGWTWVE